MLVVVGIQLTRDGLIRHLTTCPAPPHLPSTAPRTCPIRSQRSRRSGRSTRPTSTGASSSGRQRTQRADCVRDRLDVTRRPIRSEGPNDRRHHPVPRRDSRPTRPRSRSRRTAAPARRQCARARNAARLQRRPCRGHQGPRSQPERAGRPGRHLRLVDRARPHLRRAARTGDLQNSSTSPSVAVRAARLDFIQGNTAARRPAVEGAAADDSRGRTCPPNIAFYDYTAAEYELLAGNLDAAQTDYQNGPGAAARLSPLRSSAKVASPMRAATCRPRSRCFRPRPPPCPGRTCSRSWAISTR